MSLDYLVKPLSYVMIIAAGYLLKRIGFFKKEDYRLVSRIMLNVTMPCAILQAFNGFEVTSTLPILIGAGFVSALLPLLAMVVLSRGKSQANREYQVLNMGGRNIGCFAMPVIEGFMGAPGVVTACIFDIGNAVMATAGTPILTDTLLHSNGKRQTLPQLLRRFVTSVPFDTYIVMLILTLGRIQLPQVVFDLTAPTGRANAFLAMLSIGLLFEPAKDRVMLKRVSRELVLYYTFALMMAIAAWFMLPLEPLYRKILIMLLFAPMSGLLPVYTEQRGGDTALAGFTNSVSIAASLLIVSILGIVL